jgi:hypothetical protein
VGTRPSPPIAFQPVTQQVACSDVEFGFGRAGVVGCEGVARPGTASQGHAAFCDMPASIMLDLLGALDSHRHMA